MVQFLIEDYSSLLPQALDHSFSSPSLANTFTVNGRSIMYFGNQGNTVECFSVASVACLVVFSQKSGSSAELLCLYALGMASVTLCIGGIYEVKNIRGSDMWK